MAIPIEKYVDITSGVGGVAAFGYREPIGRLFTKNTLVPTQWPLEFTSAADVGSFFGADSEEYKRALFYFSWVSPIITRPRKISFGRWSDAPVSAAVYGNTLPKSLAPLQGITDGTLNLTIAGYTANITGINLSGAASISDALDIVEALIQSEVYGGDYFTGATLSYSPTDNRISLVSGDSGEADISVSGTVAAAFGWILGASVVHGSAAISPAKAIEDASVTNDNFYSFIFLGTLTTDQIKQAAQSNAAMNVKFLYSVGSEESDIVYLQSQLEGISGVSVTLIAGSDDYADMVPMIVVASVDFSRPNASMTAMFKQFTLEPTVSSLSASEQWDALLVNYIGVTQTAGTYKSFYQKAVMNGGANDIRSQPVYINEIWLKNTIQVDSLNLFLALASVPANARGEALFLNTIMNVVEQALGNGVILAEKNLTQLQKTYITEVTADPRAWQQVQSLGYWVNATIVQVVVNGVTEYHIKYTLVYAKGDFVSKVDGTHILI